MNRTRLVLATLGATALLVLAGCSSGDDGGGIASVGGTQDTTAPQEAEVSDEEQALLFVECMREQGFDLPDPEPDGNGGFDFGLADAGVDFDDPAFREAIQACRDELPGGGQQNFDDPEFQERMREFAQCMRDNGVDVPDPDPNGGFGGMLGEIDPNDPAFRGALEACQDMLPQRGNG
jgi:hypothetical protein